MNQQSPLACLRLFCFRIDCSNHSCHLLWYTNDNLHHRLCYSCLHTSNHRNPFQALGNSNPSYVLLTCNDNNLFLACCSHLSIVLHMMKISWCSHALLLGERSARRTACESGSYLLGLSKLLCQHLLFSFSKT